MNSKLTETQIQLKELILKHNKNDMLTNPTNPSLRGDVTYLGSLFATKLSNEDLKYLLGNKIQILTMTVDSKEQSEMLGDVIKFYETIDLEKNTSDEIYS